MSKEIVLIGDIYPKIFSNRPLTIYRLASHLRDKGYEVDAFWGWVNTTEQQFYDVIDKIVGPETKVVGISATLMYNPTTGGFWGIEDDEAERRILYIKSKNPSVKVICGGSQIQNVDASLLTKYTYIDYFISGQGEEILLNFVELLEQGKKPMLESVLPKIITDKPYPFLDFNKSPTIYTKDDVIIKNEPLNLELARGCIFNCAFCSYSLNGKKREDYTKSNSTLREELLRNYGEYGTTSYLFVDDLINDSEEKVDMIYDVASSLPFKIKFSGFMRLDLIWKYKSMAQKLVDSGCVGAFFGIETLNDASGKTIQKGLGKRRIEEGLLHAREAWKDNVIIEGSFILGLPKDQPDVSYELEDWLMNGVGSKTINYVSIYPLHLQEGGKNDIANNPEEYGYKKIIDPNTVNMRTIGSYMDWEQQHGYTFTQAQKDAKRVFDNFFSKKNYPQTTIFGTPWMMKYVHPEYNKIVVNNKRFIPGAMTPDQHKGMLYQRTQMAHKQNYYKYYKTYMQMLSERQK